MTDSTTALRVLIAASGSGGHLIPAVVIAEELKKQTGNAEIEFIGSGRRLESEIIDKRGYKRNIVSVQGIKNRGLKGLFQFAVNFPKAWFNTFKIIRRFKPDLIIGVGGYVSFLPVTVGWMLGVPTWIHEAEEKPGLANSVLSRYCAGISLAHKNTQIAGRKKAVFTGQPVRSEFSEIGKEQITRPENLLIMGGSQGAEALDKAASVIAEFAAETDLDVFHQARSENVEEVRKAYSSREVPAQVETFIEEIAAAYSWSDIIISRSGASSVREIALVNRPVVFVPFPYAQANHQFHNAKLLADAGKAVIVEEKIADFNEVLLSSLRQILKTDNYAAMRQKDFESDSERAAERVVKSALVLIKK